MPFGQPKLLINVKIVLHHKAIQQLVKKIKLNENLKKQTEHKAEPLTAVCRNGGFWA